MLPGALLARVCIGLLVALLAGCSGAEPAAPARTAPPSLAPSPSPGPWSSGWMGFVSMWDGGVPDVLMKTCDDGTPVPGAAPYAGAVHPLLVMDEDQWDFANVDVNRDFPGAYGWSWPSPLQLVLCVTRDDKEVGSCGLYTSGGKVHEVTRDEARATIRVVEAATGATLQTKVLKNAAPKCPKTFTSTPGYWVLVDPVTDEEVDTYAATVTTQPVE
jgi:hypothetical protein